MQDEEKKMEKADKAENKIEKAKKMKRPTIKRKSGGLKVRGKLNLSFAFLLMLLVASVGVGVTTLLALKGSFSKFTDEDIAKFSQAASLSLSGTTLAVATNDLMNARTVEVKDLSLARLTDAIDNILKGARNLEAVESDKTDQSTQKIIDLASSIEENIVTLDFISSEKIHLLERKDNNIKKLFEIKDGITKALIPLIDDAYFDLMIGGERASNQVIEIITGLTDKDMMTLRLVLELRFYINLVHGDTLLMLNNSDAAFIGVYRNKIKGNLSQITRRVDKLSSQTKVVWQDNIVGFVEEIEKLTKLSPIRLRSVSDARIAALNDDYAMVDRALFEDVDDRTFQVSMSSEWSALQVSAIFQGLLDKEAEDMRVSIATTSTVNEIIALAVEVSSTQDFRELIPLNDRILSNLQKLNDAVAYLGALDLRKTVRPMIDITDQETGFLALRQKEFEFQQASTKIVEQTLQDSQQISALVRQVLANGDNGIRQDLAKLVERINSNITFLIILGVVGVAIALIVAVWIVNYGIAKPLLEVSSSLLQLANNRTDVKIPNMKRTDEIGDFIAALSVFKDNAIARNRLQKEAEVAFKERAERHEELRGLIKRFRLDVKQSLDNMFQSSHKLRETAEVMNDVSKDTSSQATSAASASDNASKNVSAVASATEELAVSSKEIAKQMETANGVFEEVAQHAYNANSKINDLSSAANTIGDVSKLISYITEQTNLLALNATIEASRAGAAGKGFAVVASAVKTLANQTSTAATQISDQIASIQNSTAEAVIAIQNIVERLGDVTSYSAAVSSAVEEQSSTTQEISVRIHETSNGTTQAVNAVEKVRDGANKTNESASAMFKSSDDISQGANQLNHTVETFLTAVSEKETATG